MSVTDRHALANIDPEKRRGDCSGCGRRVRLVKRGTHKTGPLKGQQNWGCRNYYLAYNRKNYAARQLLFPMHWARRKRARAIVLSLTARWMQQVTLADISRATGIAGDDLRLIAAEFDVQSKRMQERVDNLTGPRQTRQSA